MKFLYCLLLLATVSGCTTTKVQNVRFERGQLLKHELSEPVFVSNEYKLSLSDNYVDLKKVDIYTAKEIKIYEKVQSTNLKKEGSTVTDSPFMAIIGTPGAILADIFTLGTVGFTSDMWVKDTHEWETVKKKLEDDYIVDERAIKSSKVFAVNSSSVSLFINDKYVRSINTDASGIARYDFAEILNASNTHPKQFITDKGVKLEARFENATVYRTIPNTSIPEAYFVKQFNVRRGELEERKGRFENCSFIANSKREFFECFYQK